MKITQKILLCLSLLCLLPACQGSEAVDYEGIPLVLRVEVPEGTEGAVACDYLQEINGTIWFGKAHAFDLKYAGATIAAQGQPAVAVEIVSEQKDAFSDFTGSIVGQRMAIEIDGQIFAAPTVLDRLPGSAVITSGAGFSEDEAKELAFRLRNGK
jgi:hypothetical protein